MNVDSIHVAAAIVMGLHPKEEGKPTFQKAAMVVRNTGGVGYPAVKPSYDGSSSIGGSEIAKFYSIKNELRKLHNDLSIMLKQEAANEMAMIELDSSSSKPACLFELLAQIMFPQDGEELYESKLTVQRRLDFIREQKEFLQKKIIQTEHSGQELAKKINAMHMNGNNLQ
ncbi:hypothetical protein ACA910_001665 [Epithemia clementina (nom. ined.)]